MGKFIKGDIVVIPFPFSDLSDSKKRPAFVLADLTDDVILCQITSKNVRDEHGIALNNADFISGSLPVQSNIRPNRIFTADKNIIIKKAGNVSDVISKSVVDKIIDIITK